MEVISGLHTPLGLLWYRGTLYVASTGRVDTYSNLRGNRFTTHKKIVTLPAKVGESNRLVLAPNGRILMGISASCDHCTPASKLSGAIVSFLPDGRDVRVYASGIRAPIGLAYYPGTSDLFVTMNQRDDLGTKTPGDWLSVVRAGESWGFPACYGQGGSACNGVPDPVAVLDTHAAAGDVAMVTGRLATTTGTAALVAEWAKGTVLRVALHPSASGQSGSSYTGSSEPFLTGLKNPVALVSYGNAVYVGDWTTGKIYAGRAGVTNQVPCQQLMITDAILVATSERTIVGMKAPVALGTFVTSTTSTFQSLRTTTSSFLATKAPWPSPNNLSFNPSFCCCPLK